MSDENPQTENDTPQPENEPETFDKAYVQKLRDEAATYRVAAREAGETVDRLREAVKISALREAAGQHLADPTDLPWSDDFWQADGLPDVVAIADAAHALALREPHRSRARGDIGQGNRGDDSGTIDIAGLLRGLT